MFYYQKLELFMLQATEQKAWLKYMKHAQQAALFLAAQLKWAVTANIREGSPVFLAQKDYFCNALSRKYSSKYTWHVSCFPWSRILKVCPYTTSRFSQKPSGAGTALYMCSCLAAWSSCFARLERYPFMCMHPPCKLCTITNGLARHMLSCFNDELYKI